MIERENRLILVDEDTLGHLRDIPYNMAAFGGLAIRYVVLVCPR